MASVFSQTFKDFEIVVVNDEGPLAKVRNEGAKRAQGDYLVFIDDDVVCEPRWLESIVRSFKRGMDGVSGPSYTSAEYRKGRDCFKFPASLFSSKRPGQISDWGQWSLAATDERCSYEGEVDYLEACNMAFTADAFWTVGGFDERFGGIGDWSEPDLCFRLRKAGFKLWFSRDARLEHRPSKTGAYKKRLVKCDRMENYELFSRRWIQPSWKHNFYKFVLRSYFTAKEYGIV